MNIHVGNLPLDCIEQDLRSLFETCGKIVSLEIISNIRTHEPLGYGFVVMGSEEEGLRAIEQLNGKPLKGKTIVVTRANRPRGRRKPSFRKPNFR